jgi:hypothetical protein
MINSSPSHPSGGHPATHTAAFLNQNNIMSLFR